MCVSLQLGWDWILGLPYPLYIGGGRSWKGLGNVGQEPAPGPGTRHLADLFTHTPTFQHPHTTHTHNLFFKYDAKQRKYTLVCKKEIHIGFPKGNTYWFAKRKYTLVFQKEIQIGFPKWNTHWFAKRKYILVCQKEIHIGLPKGNTHRFSKKEIHISLPKGNTHWCASFDSAICMQKQPIAAACLADCPLIRIKIKMFIWLCIEIDICQQRFISGYESRLIFANKDLYLPMYRYWYLHNKDLYLPMYRDWYLPIKIYYLPIEIYIWSISKGCFFAQLIWWKIFISQLMQKWSLVASKEYFRKC